MQLFFTIVYIRIIILTWEYHDHPLVEYPLFLIVSDGGTSASFESKFIDIYLTNKDRGIEGG